MALNPSYIIENNVGIPQDVVERLLAITDEAFRLWGEVLAGDADLTVRIRLVDSTSTGTASATWGNGTNLGIFEGRYVLVGAPAYELQTGVDTGGSSHDVVINISRDYLLNELYLDPTPQTRGETPGDKTDALSVMLHEIGHALGFTGYHGSQYESSYATGFDLRRVTLDGDLYFDGPNVARVLGDLLDLTIGNTAHYGNSNAYPGDNADPRLGLMNGVVFYRGYHYEISELDLAILADTGVGTILDDILNVPLHDYLRGGGGDDQIFGGSITNHLFGDEGADFLSGASGDDELYGGAGHDILIGGADNDMLDGGAGFDLASYIDASGSVRVDLSLEGVAQDTGNAGYDTLLSIEGLEGSGFADHLSGRSGADDIRGLAGNDEIFGRAGSDVLSGGLGNDMLVGGAGWDEIHGGGWSDTLFGDNGNDRLFGDYGKDLLVGGGQNDILDGGVGDDVLIGSWGMDVMTGGAGADSFVFESGHSGRWQGNADRILDFSGAEGDVIDLSAIDAVAGGADDAFTFTGSGAFTGIAGELVSYVAGGNTYVAGDTDGDGAADFIIRLDGVVDLTSGDFVL